MIDSKCIDGDGRASAFPLPTRLPQFIKTEFRADSVLYSLGWGYIGRVFKPPRRLCPESALCGEREVWGCAFWSDVFELVQGAAEVGKERVLWLRRQRWRPVCSLKRHNRRLLLAWGKVDCRDSKVSIRAPRSAAIVDAEKIGELSRRNQRRSNLCPFRAENFNPPNTSNPTVMGKPKAQVAKGDDGNPPYLLTQVLHLLCGYCHMLTIRGISFQPRSLIPPQNKPTVLGHRHHKQLAQCRHKDFSPKDPPAARGSRIRLLQNARHVFFPASSEMIFVRPLIYILHLTPRTLISGKQSIYVIRQVIILSRTS